MSKPAEQVPANLALICDPPAFPSRNPAGNKGQVTRQHKTAPRQRTNGPTGRGNKSLANTQIHAKVVIVLIPDFPVECLRSTCCNRDCRGQAPAPFDRISGFLLALALVLASCFPSLSWSDGNKGQSLGNCADDVREGYHFYCDPEEVAEEEDAPAMTPKVPAYEDVNDAQTATEEMMAYRARLDELKHEAVLRPTQENLEAYMTAQLVMIRKAQEFTEVWQRVLLTSPELDTNTRYPLTNVGANLYQDKKSAAQEAALRKVAETSGIMFVFEHESTCPVCPLQAAIVADLRDAYDVPILPITVDGWSYEPFPDVAQDQGQLKALGLDDFPRPVLGILDPATGAIDVIGVGLITREAILDRVHLLTEVEPGERFAGGIP